MCKQKTTKSVLKVALDQAKKGTLRNISEKGKIGWVVHGYYSAFYALFNFDTYTEAIREIILMKGDTDTNSCIAGGLLGAFYGFDELYKQETYNIDVLLESRVLKGDGDVLRPKKYTLSGIKEKIRILTSL